MGRDKSLVEIDGRPMAARVADALRSGGCDPVLAIGGHGAALVRLGLEPVADRWPGEGPLGGLATGLAAAVARRPDDDPHADPIAVVAPCDWLRPDPALVQALAQALGRASKDPSGAPTATAPGATVAVPVVDGRRQWVHAAWRATPDLAEAMAVLLDRGARRMDAVATLVGDPGAVIDLPVVVAALDDADSPEDLPRQDRRPATGGEGLQRMVSQAERTSADPPVGWTGPTRRST